MSEILDSLNTVMVNVAKNRKNVADALTSAETTAGSFSPDVAAALDLLLATFPTPQIAAQMLGARAQIDVLTQTASEMDAMIAALQVVISDEVLVEATQAQATVNAGATNSPLSDAAGSSESPAAAEAAPASTDAPAAPVATDQA